jgi:hypothetical protein
MGYTVERALVRTILEHAADFPWKIQHIGLLGLRLDDRRECRLHVWDPDATDGDPPIHDHPYDFSSTVIVGEVTNTRYAEDPRGPELLRERYALADEDDRRADTIRLVGTSTVLRAGDRYHQQAAGLHDSREIPGTVTVIRCTWHERSELTVCRPVGAPWVSGQARPATTDEIKRITSAALDLFPRDGRPS